MKRREVSLNALESHSLDAAYGGRAYNFCILPLIHWLCVVRDFYPAFASVRTTVKFSFSESPSPFFNDENDLIPKEEPDDSFFVFDYGQLNLSLEECKPFG
jgi:hypothetical protein